MLFFIVFLLFAVGLAQAADQPPPGSIDTLPECADKMKSECPCGAKCAPSPGWKGDKCCAEGFTIMCCMNDPKPSQAHGHDKNNFLVLLFVFANLFLAHGAMM
ncbi:hypothetical protein niasHS_006191 [Heterodera schachtii]|uniref:WAP domain-containing protein n=1 Tax=Heterodera schachtii TaxID=97005 RepID=A0ABD2JSE6_HETSC